MLSGILRHVQGFDDLLHDRGLTDSDWTALKELWFSTSAKVNEADRRVHTLGCDLADKLVTQGRYEQQVAEVAKKSPAKPLHAQEHVVEQWLTVGEQDVRRVIRIQPGESRELDIARTELRDAEKERRVALGEFLRKTLEPDQHRRR